MRARLLEYWNSIPSTLRSRIAFGAIATYVVLIPTLGIAQLRSMGTMRSLQADNQKLEKNLDQFSEKLDTLVKDGSSSTMTQELRSLRDEVIKYRAEQQGRDQVLGLTQYGMTVNDPLDSLSNSLTTLEEMTGSSSSAGLPQPKPFTVPASSPAPVPADGTMHGTITLLKDKGWSSVDAFESPVASSKIIGQIVINVSYPFYDKQNNWYQAELASGKKGWIQAQFVKEE